MRLRLARLVVACLCCAGLSAAPLVGAASNPDPRVLRVKKAFVTPVDGGNSPILIPLVKRATTDPEEKDRDNGRANYSLTGVNDGVIFDIKGNGAAIPVAWTKANARVAFLAYDKNENGVIDSGAELFGRYTLPGSGNGFDALIKLSSATTDRLDARNPFFAKLLLWEDRNHNGISEASELQPASNVLVSIGLGYSESSKEEGHGNRFFYRGWVEYIDTTTVKDLNKLEDKQNMRHVYDVFLATK